MQQLHMFANDEDAPPLPTIPEPMRSKVVQAMAQLLLELALAASEGHERIPDDD